MTAIDTIVTVMIFAPPTLLARHSDGPYYCSQRRFGVTAKLSWYGRYDLFSPTHLNLTMEP